MSGWAAVNRDVDMSSLSREIGQKLTDGQEWKFLEFFKQKMRIFHVELDHYKFEGVSHVSTKTISTVIHPTQTQSHTAPKLRLSMIEGKFLIEGNYLLLVHLQSTQTLDLFMNTKVCPRQERPICANKPEEFCGWTK